MTAPPETSTILRDHGLRVTAPRVAVLETLEVGSHLDADTIVKSVRHQLGSVSVQTVYDVLSALTQAGLLRRIEPAGSPARFERRVADNHHHVVCRQCGAIDDVDCVVGDAPCLKPAAPHTTNAETECISQHGFVVDEAEVIFWGLCPQCRSTEETH